MILKFYRTNLRPELNGVYEELESYLNSLNPRLTIPDYKYIEPDLTTSIKINYNSHEFDNFGIGNFLRASDEDKVYYYFITGCHWRGKETLMLDLALDTLNTYWEDISNRITKNSHITRCFRDRYVVTADKSKAIPVIDKQPESITTPPLIQISKNVLGEQAHWYLIYKTYYPTEDEKKLSKNPVTCYALSEKEIPIKPGSDEVTASELNDAYWYALIDNGSKLAAYKEDGSTVNMTAGVSSIVYFYREGSNIVAIQLINTGDRIIKTIVTATKLKITETNAYYLQMSSKPVWTGADPTASDYYNIRNSENKDFPVGISTASHLTAFKAYYELNKTDPTLIKILELPYAPFDYSLDSEGNFICPAGWELLGGVLRLTTAEDFRSEVSMLAHYVPSSLTKENVDVSAIRKLDYETKLYNSNYFSHKLVYDDKSWADKPEYITDPSKFDNQMHVYFNYSTSMDSSMLFEISGVNEDEDTDFANIILSQRSTEIPYYTNEYLNYLRYGKAVDERNRNVQIASAVIGAGGSTLSSAATAAFGLHKAGFGVFTGLATGILNTVTTIISANDQINAKIDQYTHQSSNINGASDLSIFKKYGKNKLIDIVYQPVDELRKSIADYFSLYGYSTDIYAKPVCTRYWWDYFVVDADFGSDRVWTEFADDIKNRMSAGFNIFHYHDGVYMTLRERENWETKLVDWKDGK